MSVLHYKIREEQPKLKQPILIYSVTPTEMAMKWQTSPKLYKRLLDSLGNVRFQET